MPDLNLRGIDAGLVAELKSGAALAQMTLRDYCVAIFRNRHQQSIFAGQPELPTQFVTELKRVQGLIDSRLGVDDLKEVGTASGISAKRLESLGVKRGADVFRTATGANREASVDVNKVAEKITSVQKKSIAPKYSMGVETVFKDGEIIAEGLSGTPTNMEPFRPSPSVVSIPYVPEEPVRSCVVCEKALIEKKGKWGCADLACSMYGREQKGQR